MPDAWISLVLNSFISNAIHSFDRCACVVFFSSSWLSLFSNWRASDWWIHRLSFLPFHSFQHHHGCRWPCLIIWATGWPICWQTSWAAIASLSDCSIRIQMLRSPVNTFSPFLLLLFLFRMADKPKPAKVGLVISTQIQFICYWRVCFTWSGWPANLTFGSISLYSSLPVSLSLSLSLVWLVANKMKTFTQFLFLVSFIVRFFSHTRVIRFIGWSCVCVRMARFFCLLPSFNLVLFVRLLQVGSHLGCRIGLRCLQSNASNQVVHLFISFFFCFWLLSIAGGKVVGRLVGFCFHSSLAVLVVHN